MHRHLHRVHGKTRAQGIRNLGGHSFDQIAWRPGDHGDGDVRDFGVIDGAGEVIGGGEAHPARHIHAEGLPLTPFLREHAVVAVRLQAGQGDAVSHGSLTIARRRPRRRD